jgi:hypothetical protein
MSRALGQANVPVYGPRPDPMVGCCPRHMNSRVLVDRATDATPTPTSRIAFVTTTEDMHSDDMNGLSAHAMTPNRLWEEHPSTGTACCRLWSRPWEIA